MIDVSPETLVGHLHNCGDADRKGRIRTAAAMLQFLLCHEATLRKPQSSLRMVRVLSCCWEGAKSSELQCPGGLWPCL
eukprot:419467-Amphidinium_carterae.1